MARIMTVVQEREKIKQAYRMQLEEEYIERKRKDL